MVFCRHCGKDILSGDARYCPFCGKPQNSVTGSSGVTSTTLRTKNPKIALVLAIFIMGVGHIYVGKLKRGIVILIVSWVLGLLTSVLFFPVIPLIIIWIWQIYDAHKQAKYYNEYLIDNNGIPPW
jgi:TM2 domain-containing membrane protein YozV